MGKQTSLSHFFLVLPIPHLLDKVGHVDFLVLDVQHPRMFQHPPGSRSSGGVFLQTEDRQVRKRNSRDGGSLLTSIR